MGPPPPPDQVSRPLHLIGLIGPWTDRPPQTKMCPNGPGHMRYTVFSRFCPRAPRGTNIFYKSYLTKVHGAETCFKNINRCNKRAQCDPPPGERIAEDELNCDEEYEKKGLVPKQAYSETFFCQSPLHNKQSVMINNSLGEVWFRAVPNDGKAECLEDEEERSSIWVSFYIPGIGVGIFLNALASLPFKLSVSRTFLDFQSIHT